jgi:hypothetical protein
VPDHRTYCHQVGERLRDDLLAQLRTARRPMSTTELRDNAPTQPIRAGSAVIVAPLQEQVYRALCVLRVHGKVEQHRSQGRIVTWVAVADTDADDEIADLEAAFQASPVPGGGQPPADPQRIAAHLEAAAAYREPRATSPTTHCRCGDRGPQRRHHRVRRRPGRCRTDRG